MSDTGDRAPLWVAAAAIILLLALPLADGVPGRMLGVRVLLVAALVLIGFAAAKSSGPKSRTLLGDAVLLLVATAVLVLGDMAASGAVLLALAIGTLLWQRRRQPLAPLEGPRK
jgi:hypothetical protein